MKRLLYLFPLVFFSLLSCSKEEEVVTPPPTPTYTLSFSAENGGSVSTEGGTYTQGSKITVTATPDAQYLFQEWSDGSTVNPREITVGSDLTLTASFVKKTYPLAVTVEGEGTVQEEVIIQGSTSETEYNAGTTVRLTATPNEGWVFAGWSGDVESTENPIEVSIEKGIILTASFEYNIDYMSLFSGINIKTSHYQPLNIPFIDYSSLIGSQLSKYGGYTIISAFANLNGNDTPDIVIFDGDSLTEDKGKIHLVIDGVVKYTLESNQSFTRKISVLDLDYNGFDDIVFFGTGIDQEPYTGDKTLILFMESNGFRSKVLSEEMGFFHGGVIGDLNNDGYNDIMPFNNQAIRLENRPDYAPIFFGDGKGDFQKTPSNLPYLSILNMYHQEVFDINDDGILDLISGGHEWIPEWYDESFEVYWDTNIFLGLGDGIFDLENRIIIPKVNGWQIITDIDIYDLNNDGIYEIIISRTSGDGVGSIVSDNQSYDGIKIQILQLVNNTLENKLILDQPDDWFEDPDMHIEWPLKTLVFDVNKDGLLDIVPESDKLNSKDYIHNQVFKGLYYRQLPDGSFEISYSN